ncbi:hypothetical protein [Enterobacter hormaechei]|uniref:hypothetical protein n=1 Tax=Enterobacter hormaechei TaxID=158836 RepID=UPI0021AE11BE|nr:hypothetical protein [Enterobacter hormaechei]
MSELVKIGHERAADLRAACGTIAVAKLISDLATQLDVQLARSNALAAENAGLKDEISNITFMRDDDFFGSTQRAQEVMGRLVNVKTPETDAFLSEVRAQGVEMFAKEMHADISGDDAREFAGQLCKGVQS